MPNHLQKSNFRPQLILEILLTHHFGVLSECPGRNDCNWLRAICLATCEKLTSYSLSNIACHSKVF